jgi:hypothetical protein
MYVNVVNNYVEAIIKCRYRLTYMTFTYMHCTHIYYNYLLNTDNIVKNLALSIVSLQLAVRKIFSSDFKVCFITILINTLNVGTVNLDEKNMMFGLNMGGKHELLLNTLIFIRPNASEAISV